MTRRAARMLACASVAALASALALAGTASARHRTGRAHREFDAPPRVAVNVALTGTATASTAAAGSPANAIDGDGSTQWCSNAWTGNLTVDLGRVHSLSGVGVTLGATSTTALVNLSYAGADGTWQPVPGAQQQSVPAGEPVYWPEPAGSLDARFVKIDVTDNDGTPPCIGELRLFERVPATTIPDRGADLSFEAQEGPRARTSPTTACPPRRCRF